MVYIFRQGNLPKLDLQVDCGANFKAWRVQLNAYISLSSLNERMVDKQVLPLMLCFTHETLTIVNNLDLIDEQCNDPTHIVEAIQGTLSQ